MGKTKTAWVIVLTGVCGCMPARVIVQHEQEGVVRDTTGAAIVGADVAVEVWRSRAPSGERRGDRKALAHFVTDRRGRFEIPETKEWQLLFVLPDAGVYYNQRICISAPGYRSGTWDPWVSGRSWGFEFPTEYFLTSVPPPPSPGPRPELRPAVE